MGTNTDPYQRAEGRYALMPGIIEALAASGTPFSILTKGTVLSRDIPLLVEASRAVSVGLGVSIALLDRDLQHTLEPGTASPQARLELVRKLREAGLPCGVFVAPVLPGLTDSLEALDALFAAIAETGATGVTVLPLHLRPGAREWFAAWLAQEHPELVPLYRTIYGQRRNADRGYRQLLAGRVEPLLRRHDLLPRTGRATTKEDEAGWPDGSLPAGAPAGVPVQQEQLALL
jgi:DNA repair photolyase